MRNVELEVKGDELIIKVDLSQTLALSNSGKSNIVASTDGIIAIPGRDEKLGLNIFRYVPAATS
jgi:hypothetical protein